ncbi:MAG: hypothetical protein ACI837_001643 [Crocinitomicaceae bacterium]|jgi:hypothetical protein
MRNLTSSNFISTVIITLCIGASYYFLDDDAEIMRPIENIPIGILLLVMALLTLPFSIIKARDLAFRTFNKVKIRQSEIFLLTMLYFMAFFTTPLIVFVGCTMIEGTTHLSDNMLIVFCGIGGIAVILFLGEVKTLFFSFPKKPPGKIWIFISNLIVPLYSGIAIAVLWSAAFDSTWSSDPNDFRKVTLSIIIAFLFILPFQRLFWYESFIESRTPREKFMSMANIAIAIAVAVYGVL